MPLPKKRRLTGRRPVTPPLVVSRTRKGITVRPLIKRKKK